MNSLIPSVTIKKEIGIGEVVQIIVVAATALWFIAGDHNGQKALAAQMDDIKSNTNSQVEALKKDYGDKISGLSVQLGELQRAFGPFAVALSDIATLKGQVVDLNTRVYNADVLARGVAKDVENIKSASALQLSQPERRK